MFEERGNTKKKSKVRSLLENPGIPKLGRHGENQTLRQIVDKVDVTEDIPQIQALIKKGKSRTGHVGGSFTNEYEYQGILCT